MRGAEVASRLKICGLQRNNIGKSGSDAGSNFSACPLGLPRVGNVFVQSERTS